MKRKIKDIPDISFHLVFGFLNLKELTLISQCSHNFRRMATNQSFLNMFSHDNIIKIYDTNTFNSLVASPFKHIIRNIKFGDHSSLIKSLSSLISQTKLLRKLKLVIYTDDIATLSAIGQLKHLEILIMKLDPYDPDPNHEIIIDTIRLLPALRVLDVQRLFDFNSVLDKHCDATIGMTNLRRLCVQPGAPSSLTTICSFDNNLSEIQQIECAQLLEKLPVLDKLDFLFDEGDCFIPILLAKWVTCFIFEYHDFFKTGISGLLNFNRIIYIDLTDCSIQDAMLQQLVTAHASRLKTLKLSNFDSDNLVMIISFETISKCSELNTLVLHHCFGLRSSEIHLLNQCKKLKEILLHDCGLKMEDLTAENQKALGLRSTTFPSLTRCEICDWL
jgi:hypothetical protein